MTDFLSIAWPGLLVLGVFIAFVVHTAHDQRRTQRRGRYRT